jgi:hypothetical protein
MVKPDLVGDEGGLVGEFGRKEKKGLGGFVQALAWVKENF